MTDDNKPPSAIRSQFKLAANSLCQPVSDNGATKDLLNTKSYAQVAPTVRPQVVRPKACGLKPGRKRPHRLMARYSKEERDSVLARADAACLSVNEFIRLSTLEADYIPPMNPELRKRFMSVQKELCRQGINLERIAEQMEVNILSPNEQNTMLGMIGWSLVAAHRAVKEAMAWGLEMPPDA